MHLLKYLNLLGMLFFFSSCSSPNSRHKNSSPQKDSQPSASELGIAGESSTLKSEKGIYQIYVSPTGSDTNPGNENKPLKSLYYAQKIQRNILKSDKSSAVNVLIKSGIYELSSPLIFDSQDSGPSPTKPTRWIGVTEKGQTVTLSAGNQVTGKAKLFHTFPDGKKMYSLPINESRFAQVYFGKQKGIRARIPNGDSVQPQLTKQTLNSLPSEKSLLVPSSGWQSWATDYNNLCNVSDAEIVLKKTWAPARHKISSLVRMGNGQDKIILSSEASEAELCLTQTVKKGGCSLSSDAFYGPFYHHDDEGNQRQPYYFENSRCFIDLPGEWYADFKSKELFFIAPTSFDPMKDSVTLPGGTKPKEGETLIQVGTTSSPVTHLEFSNLTISHTNWSYATYRSLMMWAGSSFISGFDASRNITQATMPGAIQLVNAQDVSFSNNTFRGIGADAISIGGINSKKIKIDRNLFQDVAGQAISAPYYQAFDGIQITNNVLEKIGFEYGGGGINITGGKNVSIEKNFINQVANAGISLSGIKEGVNLVKSNKLESVALEYGDAGGIYTNTTQPHSLTSQHHLYITENVIQNMGAPHLFSNPSQIASFRPSGVYLDFSSSWTAVSKNIIRNVPYGFQVNCANGNSVFLNRVEKTFLSLSNRGCGGLSDSMKKVEPDYIAESGEYENSNNVLSAEEIQKIEKAAGPNILK